MLLRVGIVGMHLYGKFVAGENKFREQRDARLFPKPRSGPFGRHLRPRGAESFSRERAVCETAGFAGQPDFADAADKSFGVRVERLERLGAPDARDAKRLKQRGRDVHEAEAAAEKKCARRRRPSSMRSIDVA
jgi:hypothetical protein